VKGGEEREIGMKERGKGKESRETKRKREIKEKGGELEK